MNVSSSESLQKPKSFINNERTLFPFSYIPKLSLLIFIPLLTLFLFLQIQSPSWSLLQQWKITFINNPLASSPNQTLEIDSMTQKLRDSVTFLPLKDLRFANKPLEAHTWFMSSMNDTHEEGEVLYQQFPSQSSKGRLLCLKGRDTRDGSRNYYALAWPESLPPNSVLMKGLTFISNSHYIYDNIWHGLSAMVPFVAWHRKNGCQSTPTRWILFYRGEFRFKLGNWLNILMAATFGQVPYLEGLKEIEDGDNNKPVCFEKAVVMRHNEGGMSKERRMGVYDLIRCNARMFCNVSLERTTSDIGMTLLLRTGARSFKNDSAVVGIFEKVCKEVEGCRLMVAYSNNLTVCEQVKLMSLTDILISPHGAQLSNLFLMDRNSSVMELFPKGWLEYAGVGQYVFHWLASWSGMRHRGTWRDPDGENCPYPNDDQRCMSMYKNGRIGYNETQFFAWARDVLNDYVKTSKLEETSKQEPSTSKTCDCN